MSCCVYSNLGYVHTHTLCVTTVNSLTPIFCEASLPLLTCVTMCLDDAIFFLASLSGPSTIFHLKYFWVENNKQTILLLLLFPLASNQTF